jgi:hypothetical protein
MGEAGSGKTYSLRTLVEAGLETLVMFLEPGMETIADISCEDGMHWHYIPPADTPWVVLEKASLQINTLSYESLTKIQDGNRRTFTGLIEFIVACRDFKCDRCGKSFGSIDQLDPLTQAFALDSLSGLSMLAMNLVAGTKPVKSQSDWQIAQNQVFDIIVKLTSGVPATVVVTSHIEKEVDELTGSHTTMASTLGRKLAPRLPQRFSEVILAKREGTKFSWSTAAYGVALKTRLLPIADGLKPSFVELITKHKTLS